MSMLHCSIQPTTAQPCAFLTIHLRFHVAGFEHMWGPATVPGLGHHSSVGLGHQQAAAPAAARLPDDFPVLDFPDWDGPGQSLHPFPKYTLSRSAAAEQLSQSIAYNRL